MALQTASENNVTNLSLLSENFTFLAEEGIGVSRLGDYGASKRKTEKLLHLIILGTITEKKRLILCFEDVMKSSLTEVSID